MISLLQSICAPFFKKTSKRPKQNAGSRQIDFYAKLSHELRTPLNAIVGSAESLKNQNLSSSQEKSVQTILDSSASLLDKINEALHLSKIDAGSMHIKKNIFSVSELISECVKLFSSAADNKNIDFFSNLSLDVPDKMIGDRDRIQQILVNLIGNAFKFTSSGYIFIDISVCIQDPDIEKQRAIKFVVRDSGIGIDEHQQEKIFNVFEQVEEGTKRKYGGLGLGLAICKQLVECMQGHIGVQSTIGKGATFYFCLPLVLDARACELKSSSLMLSKKTLVYLHQYDFLDSALREHTAANNISLRIFRHPLDVIKYAENTLENIDFVLFTDEVKLPGSAVSKNSGLDFIHALKQAPLCMHSSIMMLSKVSSKYTLRELRSVSTLLKTPVSINEIIEAFRSETQGICLNQLIPATIQKKGNASRLNVLIAEDNHVNQIVIEGLLNKLDIYPSFVSNGREALESVISKEKKYDVIFMDCEMPNMDGFEATEKIRFWERNHNSLKVPIVALTAHIEPDHRQRAFKAGMNYFLSKPLTLKHLKDALSALGLVS